ncbi:uncharacterized protein LOC134197961 [Corticium candelabrum]|uniref:uncharacterized protein LOC134197961 n=1 Tax=Corticium candelabrum TaxID=121492 RepID=UPI002E26632E|nr:uncharacterized protein LOC134197961 [Corticium candelabrum]
MVSESSKETDYCEDNADETDIDNLAENGTIKHCENATSGKGQMKSSVEKCKLGKRGTKRRRETGVSADLLAELSKLEREAETRFEEREHKRMMLELQLEERRHEKEMQHEERMQAMFLGFMQQMAAGFAPGIHLGQYTSQYQEPRGPIGRQPDTNASLSELSLTIEEPSQQFQL